MGDSENGGTANLRNFGHYLRIDIAQYREDFTLQPRDSKNLKSRYLKEITLRFFKCPLYKLGRRTVAHLVEALRYKPEGRGFDSRLCHWNFSLT